MEIHELHNVICRFVGCFETVLWLTLTSCLQLVSLVNYKWLKPWSHVQSTEGILLIIINRNLESCFLKLSSILSQELVVSCHHVSTQNM